MPLTQISPCVVCSPLHSELSGGSKVCCMVDGPNGVLLLPPTNRTSRKSAPNAASKESSHTEKQLFAFDYVFGDGPDVVIDGEVFERNSQERVFKELGQWTPEHAEHAAKHALERAAEGVAKHPLDAAWIARRRQKHALESPPSHRSFLHPCVRGLCSTSLIPRFYRAQQRLRGVQLQLARVWTDRSGEITHGQRSGTKRARAHQRNERATEHALPETLLTPLFVSAFPQVSGYDSSRTLTDDKSKDESGLIPRICNVLFAKCAADSAADPLVSYTVNVSYLEIYSEKIQDLLDKSKRNLTVRNHPSRGPYVEGLTVQTVSSYVDMHALIEQGNAIRTVAATNMNAQSSRSHAVFTVVLTQSKRDPEVKLASKVESKIQLVDLAGSERQDTSGATGLRLKEAAQINLSLSTLGRVISALAAKSQQEASGKPGKLDDNFGQSHSRLFEHSLARAACARKRVTHRRILHGALAVPLILTRPECVRGFCAPLCSQSPIATAP